MPCSLTAKKYFIVINWLMTETVKDRKGEICWILTTYFSMRTFRRFVTLSRTFRRFFTLSSQYVDTQDKLDSLMTMLFLVFCAFYEKFYKISRCHIFHIFYIF